MTRLLSSDAERVPGPGPSQGFTVLELLVALTITVVVMILVLSAVDMNANISRVQSAVSDLQQSTRVSQRELQRMVRATGRGGLPRAQSIVVTQDAAADAQVGGEDVVVGTDVLTLRAAFSTPVYRVDVSDAASFTVAGGIATLQIDGVTKSAFDQPLAALHALVDGGTVSPEAILLVGSQGDAVYAVAELTNIVFSTVIAAIQSEDQTVERATLTLNIDANSGEHAAAYLALSPAGVFPPNLTTVAFATVLEEHRFYVREDFAIPADPTSTLSPKLARARMIPGTDTLHPDASVDIADNVFDLQVALGIDLDGDGEIDIEDDAGVPLAANADEWLWNDIADDETQPWDSRSLQHVRLTILGATEAADRSYISPAIETLENRDYSELDAPVDGADIEARRYRRRLLQSTVDIRNL